jgi:hypothetical protein
MTIKGSDEMNPLAEYGLIWEDVHEYVERRALIEQAKGLLMFVYGFDADDAFEVLRTQSQVHNIKLRLIAEQVVKDLVELARDTKGPARRRAFDAVMSVAHQRITDVAARQLDGESKTGVRMKALGHSSEC